MTDYEKTKKCVEWFKDHKAYLKEYGDHDVVVVDWSRPGSSMFAMRYVFDVKRAACMITGDLGTCVVETTWPTLGPSTFVRAFRPGNMDYFNEKVRCCEGRYMYDRDELEKDMEKNLGGPEYAEIREAVREHYFDGDGVQNDVESWMDGDLLEQLQDLDQDYWEWFYVLGQRYCTRMFAYVIGLKLAMRQIERRKR